MAISVTLQLTRDGIDVTSGIIGGRILDAPAGDYVATWTASDGVLPSVTRTASLTVDEAPSDQVPAIIGGIADRTYTVGQSVPATDLRTKFDGATSYTISPALNWVSINGYNLVFDASSALEETSFAVRGVNATGQSDPVTFKLTVNVAQQAPSVQTAPTIIGSPTPSGTWTLDIGTATGVPTPTPSRLWRVNDDVQDGQSGTSFSKPGLSNGDAVRGGVRWTNSQGEVTVWSTPITLSSEPLTLNGGALTLDGDDLVLLPPVASDGSTPALVLKRGATTVTGQVVNNRIASAPVGVYEATWTAGAAAKVVTLEVLADPQIVTASGVTLPTPGLFDTMTISNLPGYATLSNPASYASTDPEGGVGAITFMVNNVAATANTALKTGDVFKVSVAGTNGEIPLVHALGTVQWTWTAAVDSATRTMTFADNPAAPGALALSVTATIDNEEYRWNATLGEIRAKPILAQGYPRLVQPEADELGLGDTISGDVGVVLTDGGLTITPRLTRNGDIDPDHTTDSLQLSAEDYDQDIGFSFLLNDGREPTIGSTPTVRIDAPEEVPVGDGVQFVAVGADADGATGNIVIAPPSGVQDGDDLVIVMGAVGGQAEPTLAGWTKLTIIATTTNSAFANPIVYTKKASGTVASVTVPVTEATAAHMLAFRGAGTVRSIALGRRGASSDGAVYAPGGAATGGSLILTVAATRNGNTSGALTNPQNASLQSIAEIADTRTLAGSDVSVTSFLGRLPEGATLTTDTTTTLPGILRWAAVQIEITGAA